MSAPVLMKQHTRTRIALLPELLAEVLSYLEPNVLPNVRRVCYEFERAVHFYLICVTRKRYKFLLKLTLARADIYSYQHIINVAPSAFIARFKPLLPDRIQNRTVNVKDTAVRDGGWEWTWEMQMAVNADGTEVSLDGGGNSMPYAVWPSDSKMSVEAALVSIEGASNKNELPHRIFLMNEDIGLAHIRDSTSIVGEDNTYTLTYSFTALPAPNHHFASRKHTLLTTTSFTCGTEAIYKVLLSHLYRARLDQILSNLKKSSQVRASFNSAVAQYCQAFAEANINMGDLSFRCCGTISKYRSGLGWVAETCNCAGKTWKEMKDHMLRYRHSREVAARFVYYGEEDVLGALGLLVEWRVKKDNKSRYNSKLP
ncbi:hypothetical protein HDV00_003350 [Rhizophlyctis rosea]|nr:hypothetical protein HDV00_003350 [Rhizophlyctis rosea]